MVITQQARRRLLWGVNLMLAAMIAAVWAWELQPPPQASDAPAGRPKQRHLADTSGSVGSLADYKVIYRHDIRRPLHDPEPVRAPRPAPKPKLALRLTGTMISPGSSYALLRTKKGRDLIASVGDTVEDARVIKIGADAVTVEYAGGQVTLRLKESGGSKR